MNTKIRRMQKSFIGTIQGLVELEYNTIEVYKAAIESLGSLEYRDKFYEFKGNHKRHVEELSAFLARFNEKAPTSPNNTKHLLAKGRVKLASIFGDENILSAILSNEEDAVTAYERINPRAANNNKMDKIILRALEDERRHTDWIQVELEKYDWIRALKLHHW